MQKSKNLNESVDDRAEYGKLGKLGSVFLSRFLACRKNRLISPGKLTDYYPIATLQNQL